MKPYGMRESFPFYYFCFLFCFVLFLLKNDTIWAAASLLHSLQASCLTGKHDVIVIHIIQQFSSLQHHSNSVKETEVTDTHICQNLYYNEVTEVGGVGLTHDCDLITLRRQCQVLSKRY